jgi:hypothetical protein
MRLTAREGDRRHDGSTFEIEQRISETVWSVARRPCSRATWACLKGRALRAVGATVRR